MSVTSTGSWNTKRGSSADLVGVVLIILFVVALLVPSFISFAIGETNSEPECSEELRGAPAQVSACLKAKHRTQATR